jgi:hypothetical protein
LSARSYSPFVRNSQDSNLFEWYIPAGIDVTYKENAVYVVIVDWK